MTQFVGYIPVGRAPDHFHNYDEVVYVLEGEGALHIAGESAPLRAGTCVHLPARLVHSLENVGPGSMRVLGVFRPAGSPAEAYYPDGTRAVVPAGGLMPRIERSADDRVGGERCARSRLDQRRAPARSPGSAFSLPTRIGQPEGKTSPEELLAAAHGGCIAMSISSELTGDGTPPGRLDVTAGS